MRLEIYSLGAPQCVPWLFYSGGTSVCHWALLTMPLYDFYIGRTSMCALVILFWGHRQVPIWHSSQCPCMIFTLGALKCAYGAFFSMPCMILHLEHPQVLSWHTYHAPWMNSIFGHTSKCPEGILWTK